MLLLALVELVVIVVMAGAFLWLSARERAAHHAALVELLSNHADERQVLIDKVQHPEITPPRAPLGPAGSEEFRRRLEQQAEHMKALGQVGTTKVGEG